VSALAATAGKTSSDEVLVQQIAAGSKPAMQALFARHRTYVYRWLLRFVSNETLAGDLLSEAVEQQSRKVADTARELKHSSARIEDSADRTTVLAADRNILASERTYAAWVRTGLLALGGGIGARARQSHPGDGIDQSMTSAPTAIRDSTVFATTSAGHGMTFTEGVGGGGPG
jgi:hypothetical protein